MFIYSEEMRVNQILREKSFKSTVFKTKKT